MIPVKCNIHPWMHGTFAVLKNSHYSVSDGMAVSSFLICRRESTPLPPTTNPTGIRRRT